MKQHEDTKTRDVFEVEAKVAVTPLHAVAVQHPAPVAINEAAVAASTNAVATLTAEQRDVQKQFGDGRTYQRERVVDELRFWAGNATQSFFEMGKRLLVIKAHEGHGFFTTACESIGIHTRTAQRMMLAATKIMASPAISGNLDKFLVLGQGKILDLVGESEETLEQLASGQPLLSGIKLDDLQRMSNREMQAKLREAEAISDARGRLIEQKNARIDELEAMLTQPYQPKAGSIARTRAAEQMFKALQERTAAAVTALLQLQAIASDITEDGCLGDAGASAIEGAFGYAIATMRDQVNTLGLTLDTSNEQFGLAPDWLA